MCLKISANVLQLGEVAEIEAQLFSFAQKFNRSIAVEFSTKPAILPNCCYVLPFFCHFVIISFVLYFIVKMSIPAIIKSPPTAIFQVNCSFRKKKDSANVIIMLPLSINAISETLPTFIAL